ncbi:MAG TPA: hypothetical protein VFB04_07280 [Terriglobales bacterium]|nr:hypothetical protein [Terriglobales bacterium]
MKNALRITAAVLGLMCGAVLAQQSGTINTLSVNPRQNQELTNSTGTETGQPTEAVPGSETEPNGLVPVTSNMVGSGSNGNMDQSATPSKGESATAKPASSATAATNSQSKAKPKR